MAAGHMEAQGPSSTRLSSAYGETSKPEGVSRQAVPAGCAMPLSASSVHGSNQNSGQNNSGQIAGHDSGQGSTLGMSNQGSNADRDNLFQQFFTALARTVVRQFRFPPLIRGCVEVVLFCSVFLAAGIISLGSGIKPMLGPMVPFVLMMMFCMVASGVYRSEITHSILNLYIHSIYGFFLASIGFIGVTFLMPAAYSQPKFIFFFLFFAFFVMNTLRPVISGTDFMDGGGRRGN